MKNPIEAVLSRDDVAIRKMPENDLTALLILAAPKAGKRLKLRSIKTLADAMKINDSLLYKWARMGKIPLHRAFAVARISSENDGLVDFEDLKPYLALSKRGKEAQESRAADMDTESEDLL